MSYKEAIQKGSPAVSHHMKDVEPQSWPQEYDLDVNVIFIIVKMAKIFLKITILKLSSIDGNPTLQTGCPFTGNFWSVDFQCIPGAL